MTEVTQTKQKRPVKHTYSTFRKNERIPFALQQYLWHDRASCQIL